MTAATVTETRPFPWEKSYPEGIRWDDPIRTFTLGDYLAQSVARFEKRPALIYRDATISYRELGDFALSVAAAFARLPEAADGVAIYLPNTPFHPITFFGAASAARRIVQLSPLDALMELEHKLKDSGARVLVTLAQPDLLEKAMALRGAGLVDRVFVADDAMWGNGPVSVALPPGTEPYSDLLNVQRLDAPVSADPSAVALLQYTGGTTGRPKGAMLTHANITAAAEMSAYLQSVRDRPEDHPDRVLLLLPLFHSFALAMLLRHLGHGNTVIMGQRFDADQCLSDIEKHRITIFHGVPTMWIALCNHPDIERRDLTSLALPTSGGAPLPIAVAEQFRRLTGLRIFQGWGMTEGAAIGTQHSPIGEVRRGSIGMPQPNFVIQIVDIEDSRRVLPVGQTGELRIDGPNVFQGYWNKPEENARAFVDGYFLTGDVGHLDDDGYVYITDRKKDMIISGGYNVYPRVLEEAIHEHPAVAECLVIGVPDAYRGQAAKAFVALKPGASAFTFEELKAFLRDRVGRHEIPVALEFRAQLPRSSVGKLSKLSLEQEEAHRGPPTLTP